MSTEKTSPLKEAMNVIEAGVQNLLASESWVEYLRTQATFHRYSFQNTIWLMVQAADRGVPVSRFAGYETWKKLGRQVRKGEKSFRVLAPCFYKERSEATGEEVKIIGGFRTVPVFDISQTEGDEIPDIVTLLDGSSDELREAFEALVKFSAKRGVPVIRKPLAPENGYFSREQNHIAVHSGLSDLHALKTLCHEVAHSILHATDEGSSRSTKEVEAESTAFVVMHALGLDTSDYSFGYVASWSNGDTRVIRGVAERVQKAAKEILSVFEEGKKSPPQLASAA